MRDHLFETMFQQNFKPLDIFNNMVEKRETTVSANFPTPVIMILLDIFIKINTKTESAVRDVCGRETTGYF